MSEVVLIRLGGAPVSLAMDPHVVFLHKHRDLAARCTGRIEGEDAQYSALMAAPLIREMVMGKPSMIDMVNDNRVKVWFRFCPLRDSELDDGTTVLLEVQADGFDPDTAPDHDWLVESKLDGFLKAPIAEFNGTRVTVKDIIDFAANAAGGVHFADPTRGNRAVVAALNDAIDVNGYESVLYLLMAIGRVVVKATQPLVDMLRERE